MSPEEYVSLKSYTVSREEARAVLAEERAQRERDCNAAIARVLQEHRCRLEPEVVIRGQAVMSRIVLITEG
jgi:hypothetical protein